MIRLFLFSNYFLFLFLFSCSPKESEITNKYAPAAYYQNHQLDTQMANLITYIYVKPKSADYISKFEPKYRSYYTGHINKFELCYYFIAPGNIHYYYMIRPARSVQGITRGVGGKFSMDKNGNIIDFEELFNTPVMPVEDLKSKGKLLFEEMIEKGNVNAYLNNTKFIEWPDDRLKYDKLKKEWRYDMEE